MIVKYFFFFLLRPMKFIYKAEYIHKGRPNVSGISVITPPFKEKDYCKCVNRVCRVLGMHAIFSESANECMTA